MKSIIPSPVSALVRLGVVALALGLGAGRAVASTVTVIIRVPAGTAMPAELPGLLAQWRQAGDVTQALLLADGRAEKPERLPALAALAALEFADEAAAATWQRTAAGMLPAGLVVRRADVLAQGGRPRAASPQAVFIVNTYTPLVSAARFAEYVQGYVNPLYAAMLGTGHLVRYTAYLERGEAGRVDALNVLEYRDEAAFAAMGRLKASIRKQVAAATPSYAAFDKIKDTLRIDGFGTRATGVLLPVATPAGATSLARIRQRGRLIVGSNMVFPTFNFRNPATGRNEGFMADLARAVARQLLGDETKVEFHQTNEETRFDDVNHGVVDVLIDTIPVNEEKLKVADFSSETFVSGSALLVKSGSPIKSIEDIKPGMRVAYGSANQDVRFIKAKAPAATYLEFEKSPDAMAALQAGQADVFTQVVTHLFRAASQNPGYVVTGRFTTKSYCMAVRKGDAGWQSWLNAFLEKFRASGEYDRLYAKWFAGYGGENVR